MALTSRYAPSLALSLWTVLTMRPESERLDLYHHYARQLLDVRTLSFIVGSFPDDHNLYPQSGHAYRCFCSPDRLAQTRERLARAGLNSTYDKHCLSLSSEDVARRVRAGEKNVVRLNVGAPIRASRALSENSPVFVLGLDSPCTRCSGVRPHLRQPARRPRVPSH